MIVHERHYIIMRGAPNQPPESYTETASVRRGERCIRYARSRMTGFGGQSYDPEYLRLTKMMRSVVTAHRSGRAVDYCSFEIEEGCRLIVTIDGKVVYRHTWKGLNADHVKVVLAALDLAAGQKTELAGG